MDVVEPLHVLVAEVVLSTASRWLSFPRDSMILRCEKL
jgi:hypothetical protein